VWAQNCKKLLLALSCLPICVLSVHMEQLGSNWTDFHEIWYSDKTLHGDHYTFLTMSRSVLLRMKNISDKSYRLSQNTLFKFNKHIKKLCCLWYNVENFVELDRLQMTIWSMSFTCQITQTTDTHSEYAIVIAFPQQQWLHKHASVLHYTYIACFVMVKQCYFPVEP
jgi:hypothetical protein